MSQPAEGNRLTKAIKKYLITGILVWLPIAVTIWVITYVVSATDQLINLLPTHWQPKYWVGFNIPGLGFIVAIIILFFTGLFAANMLGKRIILIWDSLLGRIPVVKSIYSSVKKVSESLLSDSRQSFKTPVLVPFPQSNIWTVAFVSGNIPASIATALPENSEYIPVYVPTTPNPTGGYYIMVNKQDVRPLDMSVDDALKYIISIGMVLPDDKQNTNQLELLPQAENISDGLSDAAEQPTEK